MASPTRFDRLVGKVRETFVAAAHYPFIDWHDAPHVKLRGARKPGCGVNIPILEITAFPMVARRLARVLLLLVLLGMCSLGLLIGIALLSPILLPILGFNPDLIQRATRASVLSCSGLVLTSGAVMAHLVHSYGQADRIEHNL